jgi:hypothetical protein
MCALKLTYKSVRSAGLIKRSGSGDLVAERWTVRTVHNSAVLGELDPADHEFVNVAKVEQIGIEDVLVVEPELDGKGSKAAPVLRRSVGAPP